MAEIVLHVTTNNLGVRIDTYADTDASTVFELVVTVTVADAVKTFLDENHKVIATAVNNALAELEQAKKVH